MQVILRQDVKRAGNASDVVDVADGVARNYLLPRKLALRATSGNLKVIENEKKVTVVKMEKEKQNAQAAANRLSGVSITIAVEVGEEDKLFGSVTAQDIGEALAKEGTESDKNKIALEEPRKELGVFQIEVKMHPEVSGGFKLWVVKK